MKIYTYVFLLISISLFCQQGPVAKVNNPEKVYRYIYVEKEADWYQQQASLWQRQVENDLQNADAWYNYFMAARYSRWRSDADTYKKETGAILKKMGEYIPDSYEYNYLKYYNGDRDLALLEKAYRINPERADALYEFILHFEKNGDKDKLKKFCSELYQSRDIAPGLLTYNYNVLASAEANALLFTNGDNDSYPCWVLQENFGIRQDVSVLNLHLCFTDRDYFQRKLSEKGIKLNVTAYPNDKMSTFLEAFTGEFNEKYPDIPVYAAMTVYKQILSSIEDKLYMVGLAFKYSPKRFDNWAIINTNIQQNLHLDYLTYDWYSENYLVNKILDRLHLNYVVLFLKLAEGLHEKSDRALAVYWKKRALHLAEKGEDREIIKHINALDW